MHNKKQVSLGELGPSYFDLQADIGSTKHAGSIKTTRELIELCNLNEGKYVLDVGCGVGMTSCYIAKNHSCRVVGIDISERMIDRSNERAKRESVKDRVEFKVVDAQNLPFDHNLFDAVISESVTALLEDKQRALSEYVRVTKPSGYVGLNEMTWMKTPPKELVEYYYRSTGIKPETFDNWKKLIKNSRLKNIILRTYRMNAISDFIDIIKQLGFKDFSTALHRFLFLYITSSAYRTYINAQFNIYKETGPPPKTILEYLGYGIFVGRK